MPKAKPQTSPKVSQAAVSTASKAIQKAPTFSKGGVIQHQPKGRITPYMIFEEQMQKQMKSMDKFNGLTDTEKSRVVSCSWAKLNVE